jgi:hypothetical protein
MTGGYTLTLLCDAANCPGKRKHPHDRANEASFTDEEGGVCRKAARKAGWRWREGDDVLCPTCVKERITR